MRILFFFVLNLTIYSCYAQTNYNRIGLHGSYIQSMLNADYLNTTTGAGFLAGFSTRGAFYNNFDLIYGIDFIQTELNVIAGGQEVAYTLSGAQLKFLASYLIAGENLSVEFGPILQVNGGLKLENQNQENLIVEGYTSLVAADLQEISRVNGLLTATVTGGFDSIRLTCGYQYNVNNILNKLNKENLETKDPAATNFKGNLGMLTAGIVVYL